MADSWVAGVDGCPAGWIAVLMPADGPAGADVHLCRRFTDVLALRPAPLVIAVDCPIGLPARAGAGGRGAERAARKVLGARQSSVFSVPSRAAVMQQDYAEACAVAQQTSDPARKVSKQSFHIFPKIREVDACMDGEARGRVFECHPEVAFWALNGEREVPLPKKVKSRRNPAGLEYRRGLLGGAGFDPAFLAARHFPQAQAADDDFLDACAAAWTAARIHRGEALSFPPDPERDERGLAMAIWA